MESNSGQGIRHLLSSSQVKPRWWRDELPGEGGGVAEKPRTGTAIRVDVQRGEELGLQYSAARALPSSPAAPQKASARASLGAHPESPPTSMR